MVLNGSGGVKLRRYEHESPKRDERESGRGNLMYFVEDR